MERAWEVGMSEACLAVNLMRNGSPVGTVHVPVNVGD